VIRALLRTPTGWLAAGLLALALHAWIDPIPTTHRLCVTPPGQTCPAPPTNPDGSVGNYTGLDTVRCTVHSARSWKQPTPQRRPAHRCPRS
jgi:hypothetical protein